MLSGSEQAREALNLCGRITWWGGAGAAAPTAKGGYEPRKHGRRCKASAGANVQPATAPTYTRTDRRSPTPQTADRAEQKGGHLPI